MRIADRDIGFGFPVFIVAELSCNHGGEIENAKRLIRAAKSAGADAVKLQVLEPGCITVKSNHPAYTLRRGPWAGCNLYDLYESIQTPWDWVPELFDLAESLGLICFASAFCTHAVDFLETLDCPAYKVASPELVDQKLVMYIASKRKPVILSTGMANASEIRRAVHWVRSTSCELAILHCVSAYPSPRDQMNLRTITDLRCSYADPIGLSDHSVGHTAVQTAVALGATIVERHIKLMDVKTEDWAFSLSPWEFTQMVYAIREVEEVLGRVQYGPTDDECVEVRRRLVFARPFSAGQTLDATSVRTARVSEGLTPAAAADLIGRTVNRDVDVGEPVTVGVIA